MVRQRKQPIHPSTSAAASSQSAPKPVDMSSQGLGLGQSGSLSKHSQWMFFAIASGACAAFNGVFAKLTTTELTTKLSTSLAQLIGLESVENIVEFVVRAMFFILNLTFNGVMWTLFTQALARGTSTTQVSIINTSTNFMITALLGLFIFAESLPPMWWAGATLLVAGNVIVGSAKEEADEAAAGAGAAGGVYEPVAQEILDRDEDEDVVDLGDMTSDRR